MSYGHIDDTTLEIIIWAMHPDPREGAINNMNALESLELSSIVVVFFRLHDWMWKLSVGFEDS